MDDDPDYFRLLEFLLTKVSGYPLHDGEIPFLRVHKEKRRPFGFLYAISLKGRKPSHSAEDDGFMSHTVCRTGIKHSLKDAAIEMIDTIFEKFRTGIGSIPELGLKYELWRND